MLETALKDALAQDPVAAQAPLPADLSDLAQKRFALMTLHRPALVDDPVILRSLLDRVSAAALELRIQVLFLAHPRTKRILERIGGTFPSVIIRNPLPYFAMLRLFSSAALILTDSGGLQEEAAILHVPCITLRTTTERPETIAAGGKSRRMGRLKRTLFFRNQSGAFDLHAVYLPGVPLCRKKASIVHPDKRLGKIRYRFYMRCYRACGGIYDPHRAFFTVGQPQ